jgi:signal transduction histidine kinase
MDLLKFFGFSKKKVENDFSSDLAHINQEMYKKGVELNERNKTLSLLQKIDQIILGSITHPEEIAQHVTSLLVAEADFPIASIFMHDPKHKILKRLAFSQTSKNGEKDIQQEEFFIREVSLLKLDSILSQAANEKTLKTSDGLINVLLFKDASDQAKKIQESNEIKSVFVYPLIVRGEMIGVIAVCLKEDEQNLSEYLKDLLSRLVQVVGIAMDSGLLYNEVQAANERLKELDKLKDEFVSVASHELRTPMTAIKSYLWMALEGKGGPLNEKQKYYLERSYSSVDRLIKLVNDMLNISRIESGRITIKMQAVDLQKLVSEVVDEVTPRADELGIHVEVATSESLASVIADSDKIKEVLFNLIGNSLKFTPKDGRITISFSQNGDMIETLVKDTGAGIPDEDMPKLFQKFGLLPGSYIVNRTASGTGLGLYISRSIIELHKGKVWAHSEGRGKGSEFHFSLKIFNEADLPVMQSDGDSENKEQVEIIHTRI